MRSLAAIEIPAVATGTKKGWRARHALALLSALSLSSSFSSLIRAGEQDMRWCSQVLTVTSRCVCIASGTRVHVLFIIIFFTIIIFLFINYHDYLDVLLDSHFASHVLVFLTARHDPSVRVYCVQDTHTPPIQPHYIRLHYITMINHVPCVCKHIGHTHTYYRARALSLSPFSLCRPGDGS